MNSKALKACASLSGSVVFALAQTAAAQTAAAPGESTELGEIVVTAQKREQRLQDVGLAVTAIGAEELATKRIATLSDLAQAVPGLVYTQSQANTPVYTLRGVGFFESSLAAYPDVATYIDQTPLPLPIMSTLTGFDLERVEVLKGPQGTLFGNNATGGAINFIAAKPSNQFGAGVSLGFARFNTTDIEAYVTGPLSDSVNARLAVKAVKGDGWQQSYTRDDTTGRTDNGAFRLLFDIKPTDRLSMSINLNGWQDRDDPQSPQYFRLTPQNAPGTVGLAGTVPANLPIFSYPLSPLTPRATDFDPARKPAADNGFWQLAARIDYEVTSSISLTSISSYMRNSIDSNIEYDGTALTAQDLAAETGTISSVTQELRLANSASETMRWVVGGNFEHTNVAESTVDLTADATSAIINGFSNSQFSSNQEMKNYAGFANLEYNIDPKVTLKSGVRYTVADRWAASANTQDPSIVDPFPLGATAFLNAVWSSLSFIYPNYKPVAVGQSFTIDNRLGADGKPLDPSTYGTAGTFYGQLKEHNVSWSIGADYKPIPDVLLYANISEGYKAGSFPEVAAAAWSQLQAIKQEKLLDYEIGFKSQLLEHRITLNGGVFYYDYSNKQLRAKIVDGIFGPLDALVNVPKSSIKGGELEVSARPIRGLTLNLAATYLDSSVSKYEGVIGASVDPATGLRVPILASYSGAALPFAPKWQTSVGAQYEIPISNAIDGFVGVDANSQSTSYAVLAITPEDKGDYAVRTRTLTNANLGIKAPDGRWQAMLWGKNVFNRYYTINTIQDYDTRVRYAGRPAEYGVAVGYKFK